MTYDYNGNVLSLQRSQPKHQLTGLIASYVSEQIDDLTYTYSSAMGDQLMKVTDASASARGFSNGGSGTSDDYSYDAQGNLQSDLNKGISSIVYNELGKAKTVNFADGRKIDYVFDAAGNKLTMKTWQGSSLISTTDYVGQFVYENNTLSFFGSPEGRVVKKGSSLEFEYAIADHQGNTRVVFSSAAPQGETPGTSFETDNGELKNFPSGGNHSSLLLFNNTAGGTYSQLLNGGNNSQVGVGKSFAVYPGDKIKIEAYAKYEGSNASSPGSFASALLTAFELSTPLPGEVGTSSAALNNWGNMVDAGLQSGDDASAPQAFVNIVIFDKDYNFLDASWEQVSTAAEQVGVSPDVPHDYMMREYTIKEAGYVFMYVSNNSPVNVYFDDVQMTYTPTRVNQYNEYYPFGLETSNSWTREGATDNNYLYNEANELNRMSGWYEMFYRGYDPAIGRMLQVDPYASSYAAYSPYNYAASNPIMINDPSGGILKSYTPDEMAALIEGWRLGEANRGAGGGGGRRGPGSGNHWADGIQYSDWSAHGGSQMFRDAMANGARLIGGTQYLMIGGQYRQLASQNGQLGYWEANMSRTRDAESSDGYAYQYHESFQVAQQEEESWFDKHYYYEAGFSTSYGPQATLVPTPEGLVPFPYVRGGALGIKVNLGSWVLLEGQANNKTGGKIVTSAPDNVYTQGLGLTVAGLSLEYARTVAPNAPAQNLINVTGLNGLLGVEYDFTSRQLSVGMMPSASFSLGFGVEGHMKQVLRFQF